MLLEIFTILFILYEIFKMSNSKRFITLLNNMKSLEKKKDVSVEDVFKNEYVTVFLIELAYIVYTIILLFTSYWYVGLLLIALVMIHKRRLSPRAMINDGILSILVLVLVLIL